MVRMDIGPGGGRDGYRFFQYLFNIKTLRPSMLSPSGIPNTAMLINNAGVG